MALATVTAASLLGGCSSDTAVRAAEAKVTAKQNALDDATTAAKQASAQFCAASNSYIIALDRYGDVLNQTEPTVGDVKTAGQDLEQPGQDAASAGQAAVEARDAVTRAEQELAAAQAALAALQASATGRSPSPSASASATSTPVVASEVVARVRQAEDEFATATEGIVDATPLRAASQQFNAAAVALEMAWLQLHVAAGCLTDTQQEKASSAVHDYTIALQQDLADAGYYPGKVDGVYGPSTVAAVEALQKAHGLPVTGTMDKATEEALRSDLAAKGGAAAQSAVASTAAVQQTLKLAGHWDGPVDGQWSPALTDALKSFQTELGVPATGTLDSATVAALEHAIETAQQPPTASPTSPPSSTPSSRTPSSSVGSASPSA